MKKKNKKKLVLNKKIISNLNRNEKRIVHGGALKDKVKTTSLADPCVPC